MTRVFDATEGHISVGLDATDRPRERRRPGPANQAGNLAGLCDCRVRLGALGTLRCRRPARWWATCGGAFAVDGDPRDVRSAGGTRWTPAEPPIIPVTGLAVAVIVRVALLPGYVLLGDLGWFGGWAYRLATDLPFGQRIARTSSTCRSSSACSGRWPGSCPRSRRPRMPRTPPSGWRSRSRPSSARSRSSPAFGPCSGRAGRWRWRRSSLSCSCRPRGTWAPGGARWTRCTWPSPSGPPSWPRATGAGCSRWSSGWP